ncbi:MAG: DUF1616 domain-containing protein [Candidatus Bathyarchaeota archaeon]|nr:DUF1616 domain-containing protein [Candidatus Bathyarchaeota archaeon]
MNLKDYRILFAVCCLGLSFFAVAPTLNMFVPFYVEEPFSELSILGPAHMAKDYPFNVQVNSEERLFVTVGNHMGESVYYAVYLKFRNQTQSIPNNNEPSSLAPLDEFRVFLLDGEKWEGVVRIKFLEALRDADTVRVKKIMINNVVFEVDSVSTWDSEYNGFFFQLFFELWLYDMASRNFEYYERGFVGVWLNMTI